MDIFNRNRVEQKLEDVEDFNERIALRKQYRKKYIRKLAIKNIKEEQSLLWLALFCLIFPAISFGFLKISCNFLHSARQIVNNVCYSYVAGLIFYYLSVKMPVAKQTYYVRKALLSAYRSISTDLQIAIIKLCGSENGSLSADDEKSKALASLIKEEKDDKHIILNENSLKSVLPYFRLAQNEAEEKLCYLNALNEQEKKDLFTVIHLLDKLTLSSDTEYVLSTQLVVTKADIEFFINNLDHVSSVMASRKEEYKTYRY